MELENRAARAGSFRTRLERQNAVAAHLAEIALEHRQELESLLAEAAGLRLSADGTANHELETLRGENDRLQQLLADRECRLAEAVQLGIPAAGGEERVMALEVEVALLRDQLHERDTQISELKKEFAARQTPEDIDAADYEAELNQFRRELEADRQALNQELVQLRARNKELNDAAREAEIELSRERAQLARERAQLERLREEIRQEAERTQREAGMRERLGAIQRLQGEVAERNRPADPAAGAGKASANGTTRRRGLLG